MERLRFASPNERRQIVRQSLDFYRTLVVGGVYSLDPSADIPLKHALFKALKHCISVHPLLSATIEGAETEAPVWTRPPTLDLDNHLEILDPSQLLDGDSSSEQNLVKAALAQTNDRLFVAHDKIPSWKLFVLPLSKSENNRESRFLLLFGYYHSHGDGKSGLAFHRTFLSGLQLASDPNCPYSADRETKTPALPLLPPLEQAGKFTLTWSYLLSPLLGAYLPRFIAEPLNIHPSVTPEAEDQWRGKNMCKPESFLTGVEILAVDNSIMQKVLGRCRANRTTFTGLLHQLIVRALSQAVPVSGKSGSFVSGTAVDLRRSLKSITDNDMALCPSGYYDIFPRVDEIQWTDWATTANDGSPIWVAARSTSEGLAKRAGTLHNQPIALLGYLKSQYPWMSSLIGKRRDTSYEVSNISSFDPGVSNTGGGWGLESMIFSQPANAIGSCLAFNIVTRRDGDMTLVLSWQLGVLEIEDERHFAKRVCDSIGRSFEELAAAS